MSRKKKYSLKLNDQQRQELNQFVSQGKKSAREINRARILLLADEGKPDKEIVDLLGISRRTIYATRKKCSESEPESFLDLLKDGPRSGRPIKLDSRVEANITMIACSDPPAGSAKWTLRMIADKVVKLEVIDSISHESVREILKKKKLKPWLSDEWCIGQITGAYLWHMEDVLHQFEQPYDPSRPLLYFDECPCFLIEDKETIIPMTVGKARRYHYEYKKNGSCCVLLAFEPHTGFRYVEVRERRTAVDYAEFMKNLVERQYPQVDVIRLVQDNLNTHTPGSFYKIMPASQAFEFGQKFELHYTPKKASWLNMAEIEFAALSKQCLDRRIPDMDTLEKEVMAWTQKRNSERKTVNWKFAKKDARLKLERHYSDVKKLS